MVILNEIGNMEEENIWGAYHAFCFKCIKFEMLSMPFNSGPDTKKLISAGIDQKLGGCVHIAENGNCMSE